MRFRKRIFGRSKAANKENGDTRKASNESPRNIKSSFLNLKRFSSRAGTSTELEKEDLVKNASSETKSVEQLPEEEVIFEEIAKETDDANDHDAVSVEHQKIIQPCAPSSPVQLAFRPPKTLFNPPQEVTIDHFAIPPSPMRDPSVTCPSTQQLPEDNGLLLNLGNAAPRQSNLQLEARYTLGDPVGDIAMKRQLLDAQRLVRVILGKPLCGDQHLLETTTILEAIRSFALMKKELLDLRNKQELVDGDPPTILQTLGSPVASTPTSTCATRTEFATPLSISNETETAREIFRSTPDIETQSRIEQLD